MWARIKRLLSNKKIMVRFAFTLVILLVFRIVSYIPVPLYNTAAIDAMFAQSGSFFAILNNFTGQALQRFSILALGISPYITASIVLQLLQMVIPAMKELAETGEAGKAKINRWTRILAVVLAFIQGLALILGISTGPGNVYHARYTGNYTFGYFYMALTIAAGTAFSIWIADMVTTAGPCMFKYNFCSKSTSSESTLIITSFKFKIIPITSSYTPGIVVNSCWTPSISTFTIAAPGIDDNNTLLKAFPIVVP
jgi:preprotein translocase subunit SecY